MIICFVDGVADFLRSAFASTNPTINSDWLGAASKSKTESTCNKRRNFERTTMAGEYRRWQGGR
jgi:hypothetical protein